MQEGKKEGERSHAPPLRVSVVRCYFTRVIGAEYDPENGPVKVTVTV
jgi:hypothetical protein